MVEQYIREFGQHLTFIVVVILLLAYQVLYVQRNQIKNLEIECGTHKREGMRTWDGSIVQNPYASRLETVTDNGLTSSSVISWGNVGGRTCPTLDEANAYLANDETSPFLGGPEPPVFYDIGDIQTDRALRSAGGYNVSKLGNVVSSDTFDWNQTDEYGRKYFSEIIPAAEGGDGVRTRWIMRGPYCNKNPTTAGCVSFKNAYCNPAGAGYNVNKNMGLCKNNNFLETFNTKSGLQNIDGMSDRELLYR